MRVKVSIIGGAADGLEVSVAQLPLTLGREGDPAVPISNRWASRHHCQLFETSGQLFVRDLASKHGTYVNGSCIDQCQLHAGDRVMVGLTAFEIGEIETCTDVLPAGEDALADRGSGVGA